MLDFQHHRLVASFLSSLVSLVPAYIICLMVLDYLVYATIALKIDTFIGSSVPSQPLSFMKCLNISSLTTFPIVSSSSVLIPPV